VKEELKKLQGDWELVSFSIGGKRTDVAPGEVTFTVKGDRLSCVNHRGETRHYSVTLHPSRRPAAMDLKGGRQRELHLCVYKLEGDTLTLACRGPMRTSPT
jgi:uncharacterized protein (TIGR03067 family)